jgi:hypothetical protein
MIEHEAILALYPNIVTVRGDVAYDAQENIVQYNVDAVTKKVIELQNKKTVEQEAKVSAKESALTKLLALGLTEDEVKALIYS